MTATPLDDLLAHQTFLRRLALQLVADESTAEDLVQDTLVLALDRAPDRPAALRAWLSTSLRRLASRGRRGSSRRDARERLGARAERTDGELDQLDRRLDAQVLVAQLLRELPAAQRQVLLLRHAEERSPTEIAEQLGLSIDTVKTRLRRGLEALRSELDRRHDGRRESWALALVPGLARMGPGAGLAAAPPALVGSQMLFGKGIAMALSWKLAVAGVLGVLAVAFWPEERENGSTGAVADEAAAMHDAPTETTDAEVATNAALGSPAVESRTSAAEPVAVADETEAAPVWGLRLILEGPRDEHAPTARVRVTGSTASSGWPEELVVDVEAGAPGETLIDLAPLFEGERRPEDLIVVVEHPTQYSAPARHHVARADEPLEPPTSPWELRVTLTPGAAIVGVLGAERLEDRVDVPVIAYPLVDGRPLVERALATRSDAGGAYRLVLPGGGEVILTAVSPGYRPACARVVAGIGRVVEAGELRFEAGYSLAGEVLRGDQPVGAGAAVNGWIRPYEHVHQPPDARKLFAKYLGWAEGRWEWGAIQAETDASGRFEIGALGPVEYTLIVARPPGVGRALQLTVPEQHLFAPDDAVVLRCDPVEVAVRFDAPTDAFLRGHIIVRRDGFSDERMDLYGSADDGEPEVLFAAARDAELEIQAEFRGFSADPLRVRTPATPERFEVRIPLRAEAAPAHLTLQLEGELPPDGTVFQVHVEDPDKPSGRPRFMPNDPDARTVKLSNGQLEVGEVPARRSRIRAYPSPMSGRRSSLYLDVDFQLELVSGEARVETVRLERGGTLRLVALDAEGRPSAAMCEVATLDGRAMKANFVAHGDNVTHFSPGGLIAAAPSQLEPNLAPGRYVLNFRLPEHRELVREVEVRAGEMTELSVQLVRE